MFKKNFSPENRVIYKIKWKYMLQPDRPQMTIQNGTSALRAG